MGCVSVANFLLFATLVSIVGFLCQSISFALDEWLSIGITIPANTSAFEPINENVTVTAKFGLWEIAVYWSNGTATNSTSAKLFESPSTWTEGAPYVEELFPKHLVDIHGNLLAAEVLVSTGLGLCFFVAIGLTLHKFAPQLEKNVFFLIGSAFAILAAGVVSMSGGILYLEATHGYCDKLDDEYERFNVRHDDKVPGKHLDYCSTSFVNVLSILGGCIELIGWVLMVCAICYRNIEHRNWQRFH